jgi:uncharacterized membrane protein
MNRAKAKCDSRSSLPATAKHNVQTIAEVEHQWLGDRSTVERLGEAVARFFGTLRFILAHVIFFSAWFVLNAGQLSGIEPFDPYPFPFLGLIVGIEFIFLTTFVLMNQRHQARREEHWAHVNLQLSMLAEHEVTRNMQLLQRICTHLGLDGQEDDGESKELARTTPVTRLVSEVAQARGVDNPPEVPTDR